MTSPEDIPPPVRPEGAADCAPVAPDGWPADDWQVNGQWLELLAAVFRLAHRDAANGDAEAIRFLATVQQGLTHRKSAQL